MPKIGLLPCCTSIAGELFLESAWVANWLGTLPRLLWELGASAPASSSLALSMLHDAARFCPSAPSATTTSTSTQPQQPAAAVTPLQAALQELQPQLAPLWAVQLPGKKRKHDKAGPAPPQIVPGPIPQLPSALQVMAVDTLYHLGESLVRDWLETG